MNKEAYLKRVGYSGDLQPTLQVLRELQKMHLLNVPFENLDIHYGNYIAMDTGKIYEKVITDKRGGFCYELNGLFYELLIALGFKAKRISARVFDQKKGYSREYDHLAIVVEIDDHEYLTDVGFGEFAFEPLKLELDKVQNDRRGDFIIDKLDENWFRVSKVVNKMLMPEYIFKNQERELAEFSEMCQYHQTSPKSHFTQKRLISRPTEHGRITITGNTIKIKDQNGVTEVALENEEAFTDALWNYFKIRLQKELTRMLD